MSKIAPGLDKAVAIIKDIDFPTLPLYLLKIQREMSKPNASFRIIADAIQQDIALTARLLKIVNSASLQGRQRIENVLQALTTIGLEQFYELILSDALRRELEHHSFSKENFTQFWHHATTVANGTRFVAEYLNNSRTLSFSINENHAYFTGLFHDVGIPVMASRFEEYEERLTYTLGNRNSLIKMEQNNYQTDHSVICHLIAKMWELPESVSSAIYCHSERDLGYYEQSDAILLTLVLRITETTISELPAQHHCFSYFTSDAIPHSVLLPILKEEMGIDAKQLEELKTNLVGYLDGIKDVL